jgi:hypothetical protein
VSAIRDWLVTYVSSPDFLERYPYYAAILARLDPVDDPAFPWAAVSWSQGRLFLHVNVACLLKEPQHLRGVLLHEVHHVVLGHLTNERFRGVAHPDLLELAMEASANEYIRESLPEGAVTCERLHAFGLREGQSTLERYELLARARNEGRGPPGTSGASFTILAPRLVVACLTEAPPRSGP